VSLIHRLRHSLRRLVPQRLDRCDEPVMIDDFVAGCWHEWTENPHLIERWERLLERVPTATPFHSPDWQRAVALTMARPRRLRLVVVWHEVQVVGVLPLHIREDGLLETLAPGVSDYLDPLIDRRHEAAVWPMILKVLAKLRARRHRGVTLHNVRDDAPCRTLLPTAAAAEGFTFDQRTVEHCPRIGLPKSWDDYLAGLGAHERKELRRKVNKATTQASARVVRCSSDPAEIARTLRLALAMMEQAPDEKADAIRRFIRPLLERAAPALIATNRLWLDTLYLNDIPAACAIQFPTAAGPLLYNCGFEAAKREYSPGVVLTARIIRQAIESGAPHFDLLRGREPYKYRLGAVDRPLWMINLRRT
jgi:CelD/BcsL family acetyltransferase involved in cellulose biosynthesis